VIRPGFPWIVPVLALTLAAPRPATAQEERTLVLKDGRRLQVTRLERRGDRVRFRVATGQVFEVAADQVASPPLEEIPAAGLDEVRVQTLVLRDGRRIRVQRLARRDGRVILQTVRGEGFSVPESDVLEPPLDQIPSLDTGETSPPVSQEPQPAPAAPEPPGEPAPPPVPRPPPTVRAPGGVPDFVPIPDRWSIPFPSYPGRIVRGGGLDPYNQSTIKGDRPILGDSVFLVLTGILDAPAELRRIAVPSGVSSERTDSAGFFGRSETFFTTPRAFLSAELFGGQTAFRPKSWALKATAALNLNYLDVRERNLVDIDVREGVTRTRRDFSLEEAFAEIKLADLSSDFDALSLRAGIQQFNSDFRGFVFSDFNLGARLFGNAAGNRWQYNLAYFDLLEKETNSELNTFDRREQKVYVANLYRQDFLTRGYTFQISYHRSEDEASLEQHYDANDFLVRPARIGSARLHDVTTQFLGVTGDGHLGRLNEDNPLAGRAVDIRAHMGALELSVDRDWARFRAAGFFASGDGEPLDERAAGFDNIYDFTNFVGGPFSFWNLTPIPLTQTSVLLKGPFSLVPNLRSNKFEGQANHVNPGVIIANLSLDLDLTPKLRTTLNANYLRFHRTEPLQELLFQPGIDPEIGFDLGAGFVYRPLLSENVVVTAAITGLLPGQGFDDLFTSPCTVAGCVQQSRSFYNFFLNLRLTY
jgi:hypothetical protein